MSEPGAIRRMPRPGTIVPFGGDTIPNGWLLCNGAAVSRTGYARLYSAIGTAWGAGDGSTTFNLPDGRGKVLQGADSTNSLGDDIEASLPNIEGTFNVRRLLNSASVRDSIMGDGTGAFDKENEVGFSVQAILQSEAYEGQYNMDMMSFDASASDSVYSGSTVQPEALASNYVIRC